jgi:hypothetical protein
MEFPPPVLPLGSIARKFFHGQKFTGPPWGLVRGEPSETSLRFVTLMAKTAVIEFGGTVCPEFRFGW